MYLRLPPNASGSFAVFRSCLINFIWCIFLYLWRIDGQTYLHNCLFETLTDNAGSTLMKEHEYCVWYDGNKNCSRKQRVNVFLPNDGMNIAINFTSVSSIPLCIHWVKIIEQLYSYGTWKPIRYIQCIIGKWRNTYKTLLCLFNS